MAHDLIDLRTSSEVTGYEQDGTNVTALLADGKRIEGRALIGADGLWSNIRKRIVGDGPPRVSGHTTYRSVIPTDGHAGGFALERGDALGRPEMPHRPLSAFRLERSSISS